MSFYRVLQLSIVFLSNFYGLLLFFPLFYQTAGCRGSSSRNILPVYLLFLFRIPTGNLGLSVSLRAHEAFMLPLVPVC